MLIMDVSHTVFSFTISARRNAVGKVGENARANFADERIAVPTDTVLDEVCEIITLPEFNPHVSVHEQDHREIVLSAAGNVCCCLLNGVAHRFVFRCSVTEQLRDLVGKISSMYSVDNAFHNFEHVRLVRSLLPICYHSNHCYM
jgi:hypothetical protein